MANKPKVKIKRGTNTPTSLLEGELAIDLSNQNFFVGNTSGTPLAIGGSGTFATKTYVDNAISGSGSGGGGSGTMSYQNANDVTITGGSINGATIGASSAMSGKFTTIDSTDNLNVGGIATFSNGVRGPSSGGLTTSPINLLSDLYSVMGNTKIDLNGGGAIQGLGAPVNDNDAARKKYVDDAVAGAGSGGTTVYNTTVPDATYSVSVGGAQPALASSWKQKTIVQALDEILFPTVLASIGTNKSVSLSVDGDTGLLEIGSSYSRTLTATFASGTIKDGSGATNSNPLVGAAIDYTFTGTGISSTNQTGNTLSFDSTVVSGANSWAVTVTHGQGSGAYYDNKGAAGTNLLSSRAAGSTSDSSSSPSITGVYPYYYLKSSSPITVSQMVEAIENGTATKVIATTTGTITIDPYLLNAQHFAVAYPSSSTEKTYYYIDNLNKGAITIIFNPVSAPQSVVTSLWTRDYLIHTTTNAQTSGSQTIQLKNNQNQ